jgi:hypothetical protein
LPDLKILAIMYIPYIRENRRTQGWRMRCAPAPRHRRMKRKGSPQTVTRRKEHPRQEFVNIRAIRGARQRVKISLIARGR